MKRFAVLLIVILLGGCVPRQAPALPEELPPPETTGEHPGLYDPDSTAEAETGGALRCYPLGSLSCRGIFPAPDGLFLFLDTDNGTAITRLTGMDAVPQETLVLDFPATSPEASLQMTDGGFSCYDSRSRCILKISNSLQIQSRIPVPADLTGGPLLSRDGNLLYYTTASGIRVLDLTTNIHRLLHHSENTQLQLTALLSGDAVLQCRNAKGDQLFLSTQNGNVIYRYPKATVWAEGTDYFARLWHGDTPLLVFGAPGNAAQTLTFPHSGTEGYFLPRLHCAAGVRQTQSAVTIDLYQLTSGQRIASVTLQDATPIQFLSLPDGSIWFLSLHNGRQTLYRWDSEKSVVPDSQVYTAAYQSQEISGPEEMESCMEIIQRIQNTYGIEICLSPGELKIANSPYRLTQEFQSSVLYRELNQLEQFLQAFPAEVLTVLSQRFEGFTICLVRSFEADAGAPPDGVCSCLYWQGYHPYIFLPSEADSETILAHTLCHLMDTVVINGSSAYDTWNQLNPTGFRYDYDYTANRSRNSTAYLLDTNRYFVDMFAMSFPKEDRARILEQALLPGNQELFQAEAMQAKLARMCLGIREAFDCRMQESLPWEQYLIS